MSHFGEGNGNPLQCSCLENPMDRGAWRATDHGVARVGQDLVPKPPPPHQSESLSCAWLSANLTDCSPQGSSVHRILQAWIQGRFAISFSKASSWPRDRTRVSCTAGRFSTDWATRDYLWNLKYATNEPIYKADTQTYLWLPKGKEGGGGMDWKFGVSRYKLLHIEWINSKVLMYSKANYI